MTIEGNVISCDACGRQVSMPMKSQHSKGTQSLDAQVCKWAVGEKGWNRNNQGDFCPDHMSEEQPEVLPDR
jgi:hypothetical protein